MSQCTSTTAIQNQPDSLPRPLVTPAAAFARRTARVQAAAAVASTSKNPAVTVNVTTNRAQVQLGSSSLGKCKKFPIY